MQLPAVSFGGVARRGLVAQMPSMQDDKLLPERWTQPDGAPVSCVEKIKVLNNNLREIRAIAQDALEDAVLMGCDEAQLRQVLHALVDSLHNPYRARLQKP
jgi:hypothetical protein